MIRKMVGFLPWREGGAFGRAWFLVKDLRLKVYDLKCFGRFWSVLTKNRGVDPSVVDFGARRPAVSGARICRVFTKDRGLDPSVVEFGARPPAVSITRICRFLRRIVASEEVNGAAGAH